MYQLPENKIAFPPITLANSQGMLAYGGDLSIERLVLAYQKGIFPWYAKDEEIIWWSPRPRMVLFPNEVKISKSMRQLIRKNKYKITQDTVFEEVIKKCATTNKRDNDDAWLHEEMQEAYINLYKKGYAHSVEVWNDKKELVGGLYFVQVLDNVISGESMFHTESNTSKLAFIHLAKYAEETGIKLIDCQLYTPHLASLGAREIPIDIFMDFLKQK